MNRSGRFILLLLLSFSLIAIPPDTTAGGTHVYKNPEDVVAWVYRDFAFSAIMPFYWEDASLIEQSEETLLRYFTEELTLLIIKDRLCAEETHGICNLDFDPIFAAQDPGVMDLEITPADTSNTVRVQFTYPGSGQEINLSYEVKKTYRGWRIKDIIYSDGSALREILNGQL